MDAPVSHGHHNGLTYMTGLRMMKSFQTISQYMPQRTIVEIRTWKVEPGVIQWILNSVGNIVTSHLAMVSMEVEHGSAIHLLLRWEYGIFPTCYYKYEGRN